MPKKEKHVSPSAEALFVWLAEPDTKFDDSSPQYCLTLKLDPAEEEQKTFMSGLKASLDAFMPDGKLPLKAEKDQDTDEETGLYLCRFATAYRPSVFDATGQPLDDERVAKVGGGSIVKVCYVENFYKGFGGGMNLYLQAVQVLKAVDRGGNADSYGFQQEDVDWLDSEIEETQDSVDTVTAEEPVVEAKDDLPF